METQAFLEIDERGDSCITLRILCEISYPFRLSISNLKVAIYQSISRRFALLRIQRILREKTIF
jgi:hypothetical protein